MRRWKEYAPVNSIEWLSTGQKKRAFIIFAVLAVIIQYFWNVLDHPLRTAAAPKGVLSFEVAGTMERAQAILTSWGHYGQVSAAANTGLDCLFLVVYAGTIALGCALVVEAFAGWSWFAIVGLLLIWAQLAAAVLDSVENYSMIRLMLGDH